MAYCFNFHQTFLFFLLFHTILFQYYHYSPCHAQAPIDQKVDLTLYYESLCQYCSYFVAHNLVTLFSNDLISIVNLRLVPWGNAAVQQPSGYFQCQHGSGECLLNMVEACAIDAYPDTNNHYFFIQCIESLAYQNRESEWQSCFTQLSLDPEPLFDCYNQGIGRRLEVQYAYETSQLNPPHTFVPWVLVNNQPLREDYQNFIAHICKAYRGTSVPAACSSSVFMINSFSDEETTTGQQACYVGSQHNLTSFVPTEILQQNKEVFT